MLTILPYFMQFKLINQFGNSPTELIDFRKIINEDRRLTLREGIIYHYWQEDSMKYDWVSVLIVSIGDFLTALSSPFLLITVPFQYVI